MHHALLHKKRDDDNQYRTRKVSFLGRGSARWHAQCLEPHLRCPCCPAVAREAMPEAGLLAATSCGSCSWPLSSMTEGILLTVMTWLPALPGRAVDSLGRGNNMACNALPVCGARPLLTGRGHENVREADATPATTLHSFKLNVGQSLAWA